MFMPYKPTRKVGNSMIEAMAANLLPDLVCSRFR
jgi:hypothetical protein